MPLRVNLRVKQIFARADIVAFLPRAPESRMAKKGDQDVDPRALRKHVEGLADRVQSKFVFWGQRQPEN